jgi:hypothetical protein
MKFEIEGIRGRDSGLDTFIQPYSVKHFFFLFLIESDMINLFTQLDVTD